MSDTSSSIEKRIALMIASRTPLDRLRMASSMFDAGKKLMKAGLQNENGLISDAQLRAQMFLKLYGDSFTPAEIKRIINAIPNMQLDTNT